MKKISILLLVIVAALASCKKVPEVNTEYVDVERDLITVGTTTATIQCDYEYIATLKKAYFHYGEGSDTTKMTSAEMRVVQNTLYVELSDLKENTTYSYYYEFANGFNSMKSVTRTFKTEGPSTTITMPTVVTAEVTEITSNSAKSGGEVTNDGGAEVTERGVCWSTNANPTLNDSHIASGTGIGAFTAIMNNLEANTTYHVRAYAINEKGTAYGLDKEFKTLAGGGGANLPTVTTKEVAGVTSNSAQCGGDVTSDGGASVIERGICWSTNGNPTLSDSHIAVGSGTGSFTYTLTGLTASTTYHVRAYATNEAGTAYGLDKTFTTLSGGGGGGDVPPGAIDGLFTLCDGRQVHFSKGNLQYQASTSTWRFAENQWDYVGNSDVGTVFENGIKCDNSFISSTYDGWIDLFGWGTSGWNNGNVYYRPYDYEQYYYNNTGQGYGPTNGVSYENNLIGIYANADWGVYNAITNGGNSPNLWRTLTQDEWKCIFEDRTTPSGIRFAKATVNDVKGVILLPDNWDASVYELSYPNAYMAPCGVNIITDADWGILESNGVIFLPVTGIRRGTFVGQCYEGYYWSTSYFDSNAASGEEFGDTFLSVNLVTPRYYGYSVRLVHDVR